MGSSSIRGQPDAIRKLASLNERMVGSRRSLKRWTRKLHTQPRRRKLLFYVSYQTCSQARAWWVLSSSSRAFSRRYWEYPSNSWAKNSWMRIKNKSLRQLCTAWYAHEQGKKSTLISSNRVRRSGSGRKPRATVKRMNRLKLRWKKCSRITVRPQSRSSVAPEDSLWRCASYATWRAHLGTAVLFPRIWIRVWMHTTKTHYHTPIHPHQQFGCQSHGNSARAILRYQGYRDVC